MIRKYTKTPNCKRWNSKRTNTKHDQIKRRKCLAKTKSRKRVVLNNKPTTTPNDQNDSDTPNVSDESDDELYISPVQTNNNQITSTSSNTNQSSQSNHNTHNNTIKKRKYVKKDWSKLIPGRDLSTRGRREQLKQP